MPSPLTPDNHPSATSDSIPPVATSIHQLWEKVTRLRQELREIQQRLGTPQETPDDFVRAHQVGHDICNTMLIIQMLTDLRNLEKTD